MSRPMSLREYAELHEDPQHDNRRAEAMIYCSGCGRNFIPCNEESAEDGLCEECADEVARFEGGRI